MIIKNIAIASSLIIISSCVVSKKKYTALAEENTKLKKEVAEKTQTLTDLKANKVDMSNEESKMSYALGVNIAASLKNQGLEAVDTAAVAKGLGDEYASRSSMTVPVAQQTLKEHFTKVENARIEKLSAEGAEFLAKNSMKPGVVVLPSGLQYRIIKEGKGPKPNLTDKVKTHYHGTLVDGTVFDSSVQRGQPIEFNVNGVIRGWTEALQLMPVGSKWELYIPHYLAYGERGQGKIGPYSALIFQVELIDITTPEK